VQQLLDRYRHPRSRADELTRLRARHRAQPGPREVAAEAVTLAERLRVLRREMAELLSRLDIQSCHGCARHHPPPEGHWPGGHCCGGKTLNIFSAEEVAALKLGGTRTREWRPPRDDHAGCVFRGPEGCSLEPEDRPSICLRYLCLELREELKAGSEWAQVSRLAAELRDTDMALRAMMRDG